MADWSPWLAYAMDWITMLLRWTHVVVAIAWIGSSFYFVWLDNHLMAPSDPSLSEKGVGGELWAVHGGGFYNPHKYKGAPPTLPRHLHWFYWESYSTWLSGFALFTVVYLFNAGAFLIDRTVMDWPPVAAVHAALGFLVGFWLIYDLLCRTLGRQPGREALLGACLFAVIVFASWLACQLFAGRAAFLLVGAMLATTMSANVFFWIIPGQRKVIASMQAGEAVDPVHGQRGKQRSVHNTYFTLPVLFAMLSNHQPWAFGHAHNWLVLVLIMLAGALIRQFFVARHATEMAGRRAPWGWAVAAAVLLLGVAVWMAPSPAALSKGAGAGTAATRQAPDPRVLAGQAMVIIEARCAMCHNDQIANKGVQLHTPALMAAHAQQIYQQSVLLKAMPLNNATQMTDQERATLAQWFKAAP